MAHCIVFVFFPATCFVKPAKTAQTSVCILWTLQTAQKDLTSALAFICRPHTVVLKQIPSHCTILAMGPQTLKQRMVQAKSRETDEERSKNNNNTYIHTFSIVLFLAERAHCACSHTYIDEETDEERSKKPRSSAMRDKNGACNDIHSTTYLTRAAICCATELRSCVKVEVAVLSSRP